MATGDTPLIAALRAQTDINEVVALLQAPPPPPPPTVIPSSKLSLVGFMLCPRDADQGARFPIPWCGDTTGIMVRIVNGQRHFLMASYNPARYSPPLVIDPATGAQIPDPNAINNGNAIVEITDAGFNPDITQAARASWVTTYLRANIYGKDLPVNNPNVSGDVTVGCQAFDGTTLFTPWAGFYNVTAQDYPCITISVVQADGTWKPYGPWFADAGSKSVRGYAVLSPDGKLYCGSPITAGNSASSWGPDFVLVQKPDPSVPAAPSPINPFVAGETELTCQKQLYYPYPNNKMPRDQWTGYSVQKNADGSYTTLVTPATTFSPVDSVACAGLLNAATLIFFGRKAKAGAVVWYDNGAILQPSNGSFVNAAGVVVQGQPSDYCNTTNPPPAFVDPDFSGRGYHAAMPDGTSAYIPVGFIYSMADLAAVAAGAKNPWDVLPVETFDTTALLGGKYTVNGICPDPLDPTMFYLNLGMIEPTKPAMTVIAQIKVNP